MTYSSAYFGEKISLKEAQENKYKQISKIVDLAKDDNVLEIGCGWGGSPNMQRKIINQLLLQLL